MIDSDSETASKDTQQIVTDIYANALGCAMADIDKLLPELQKLQSKMVALKLVVRGTALLLGRFDDIDDKYKFTPPNPITHSNNHRPNRPNMPPMKR